MPCLIENPVTETRFVVATHAMRMKVYQSKPRIKLSPAIRDGQKYVEVEFDEDDAIRLSLSKRRACGSRGTEPTCRKKGFDLSGFFDRHVETAFIDYSALKKHPAQEERENQPRHPARLCRDAAATAVQRAYRPCIHRLFQGVPAILCGKESPLHPTGRNQRLHRTPD